MYKPIRILLQTTIPAFTSPTWTLRPPPPAPAYCSESPDVASTILVTPRLALPAQFIEVKFVAKV